ncbi:hypothetical protein L596_013451 [Steinernema carpocapsae]|uniref:Aminoacyl-transfer RNA synthetases class-II family profile domain-containing protein n=1 Tax=Steinernema carpocapsae TaxID=34508 RepID=A0A4U5P089_STECR|nr:hypothetical protein L596_013451 [Steinernema carpocapsae]
MLRRGLRIFAQQHFSYSKSSGVNGFTTRTHNCGELRLVNEGEDVTIYGWLAFKRLNRFLILRDSYGTVQANLGEVGMKKHSEMVRSLPYESVVRINGVVRDRGEDRNRSMATGDIEIDVKEIEVVNEADANLPYSMRTEPNEKTRMKYRYLDLRTQAMQDNLRLRSSLVHSMRRYLVEKSRFVEVETPTLFRRTPGGAAEFVVPAPKPNIGHCYSLPQSPQQFKQLLMVGGIDRYFQIARCFRDEGAKSDRQPEFTQVDLELSFTDQEGVMKLVEHLIVNSWPQSMKDLKPEAPFQRITFADAMRFYGIDKPDLRIPWKIQDCTEHVQDALKKPENEKFTARTIVAQGTAKNITNAIKNEWKRLIQINSMGANFAVFTPYKATWFKGMDREKFLSDFCVEENDAVVIAWGEEKCVQWTLGQLRNLVADTVGLRAQQTMNFAWVVDFPLFVKNEETGDLESAHHPFTAPISEHEERLHMNHKLLDITAQHYDLILNGVELGGGSIRIHDAKKQTHVIENILGESVDNLTHLIEGLASGAPPHGGFALGLDRYVAILSNANQSIRDVIAFPKSKEGRDLMCNAPVIPCPVVAGRYGLRFDEDVQKDDSFGQNKDSCQGVF